MPSTRGFQRKAHTGFTKWVTSIADYDLPDQCRPAAAYGMYSACFSSTGNLHFNFEGLVHLARVDIVELVSRLFDEIGHAMHGSGYWGQSAKVEGRFETTDIT